jgi:hypothetical protein
VCMYTRDIVPSVGGSLSAIGAPFRRSCTLHNIDTQTELYCIEDRKVYRPLLLLRHFSSDVNMAVASGVTCRDFGSLFVLHLYTNTHLAVIMALSSLSLSI